jgi:glc operon protein GlcG
MMVAAAVCGFEIAALAQATTSSAVSFWSAADAFAKGPLLVDRTSDHSYVVYAVRRDKPGGVEQHALDTDLVFVLEGSATFVTGGSVVDARTLRANETTGTRIRDGEARQLSRGDVIIVPNGTPHWFSDVSPTIGYFAVKVRQQSAEQRAPAGVVHVKGDQAFAKGGMLFDGKEGRFLRVYALRRDRPLGVELHALDTDLVFVLDGGGTFVTGGSIQALRAIGSNESTGAGIDAGTPRPIGRGDVLVIPEGTPHWLRDVDGRIDFFAVKVR